MFKVKSNPSLAELGPAQPQLAVNIFATASTNLISLLSADRIDTAYLHSVQQAPRIQALNLLLAAQEVMI